VVNLGIIESERSRQSILRIRAGVPTTYKRQAIRGIEGIRRGTRQPGVAVGVKTIVPAQGQGQFLVGLVELNAAVDCIFLAPEQAALDVHVFEAERVFGADQRW